jgi:hypothetical protein
VVRPKAIEKEKRGGLTPPPATLQEVLVKAGPADGVCCAPSAPGDERFSERKVVTAVSDLPLSFEEEHRLRHYVGFVALHLGLTFRCIRLGDFRDASRNHAMVMEAFRLAVKAG